MQKKINDLEIAVRTIDDMVPSMSTPALQKWQGILSTALMKVEKELKATQLHTCQVCFYQEYGYRDELPSAWYGKGDAIICFQHDYSEAEKLLKEAGRETDAFMPPEVEPISVGALKVQMENLPEPNDESEETLDELMAML